MRSRAPHWLLTNHLWGQCGLSARRTAHVACSLFPACRRGHTRPPRAAGFGLELLPDRLLFTAPTVPKPGGTDTARGGSGAEPPPSEDLVVEVLLRGGGVLAADYWTGERKGGTAKAPRPRTWSHVALVADAAAGSLALWVDGQSLPAMRTSNASLAMLAKGAL